MHNKNNDRRSYSVTKVRIYFILEIVALVLIMNVVLYILPKWVVAISFVYLLLNPYDRYKQKISEIKIKKTK